MNTALSPSSTRLVVWSAWVIGAFLMLPVINGDAYGLVIPATALLLAAVPGMLPATRRRRDGRDLVAVAAFYVLVVALMRLAFVGFTTDNTLGLFLSFASALVLGAAGPVVYSVWYRGRSLARLGLRTDQLGRTAALALLFAAAQFAVTLWGFDLPAPVDWVPLLVMALTVGVFESIFFRGFVQTVLEEHFGTALGIAGAAVLYGAYHVGYGMGAGDLVFLTGLGVVYAIAFALARNLLVLWPLLTPLGSFFAQVNEGEIELPWASIAGFVDVLGVIGLAIWLSVKHSHKEAEEGSTGLVTTSR